MSELSSIKVLKGRWVVKKFRVIACPGYVDGGFGRWSRLLSDLIVAYYNQLVSRVGRGLLQGTDGVSADEIDSSVQTRSHSGLYAVYVVESVTALVDEPFWPGGSAICC